MDFLKRLKSYTKEGLIPVKYSKSMELLFRSYKKTLEVHCIDVSLYLPLFDTFLEFVKEQCCKPFRFESYHQRIVSPFDYYTFGLEFIKPLINLKQSRLMGLDNLDKMVQQVENGENVILLANHQTEADPQIISILLENKYPEFAASMIFVAGDRVTSDPLAITFSMGRNLLCIHSKKHIDFPPELKSQKLAYNKRTMSRMRSLLKMGGKCIFVAPSGGRDRPQKEGIIEVEPFNSQSIEMFLLMAKCSKTVTHFYPFSLATYSVLPPPDSLGTDLGEDRIVQHTGAHLFFGNELDFSSISHKEKGDKLLKKQLRADYAWSLVRENYKILLSKNKF